MSFLANKLDTKSPGLQRFHHPVPAARQVSVWVCRLDQVHAVVSGNKLYKLQYYIREALDRGCHTLVSCGGAYSNHLVAVACAAQRLGMKSRGFVRGERPPVLSPTLEEAMLYGMELQFLPRHAFDARKRHAPGGEGTCFIPEGGYGALGKQGAAEILNEVPGPGRFHHIVCATGTGTMLAGLAEAALERQRLWGVPVSPNTGGLVEDIRRLTSRSNWELLSGYAFGGFARVNAELLAFMNEVWRAQGLPTDRVYTAKALYALLAETEKGRFAPGEEVLFIHSGGLQGNRSLPAGSLSF